MIAMIIGLVAFFTIHLIPTSPEMRKGLVDRFGEGPYRIAFSIGSFIALIVIVLGYHKLQVMTGKNPVLWEPPLALRHVTLGLMLPAMWLLVAAYVPSKLRTMVKHPMLAAVKVWALAHLLANGDMGSIILFGSFLIWAVYDRISVKKRGGGRGPLGEKQGSLIGDAVVIVVGSALYLFMLQYGHQLLIGVPVAP
ncbi:MAG: NnrU family protein [Hyphomicrobiaceae bacterium]|nr:NnrU family protein [Hyphomicrobiaceae bacterium]